MLLSLCKKTQHIDVEQDRGKRLCFEASSKNLAQHIDVEQGRGKRLCFAAFSESLAAHRC